MAHGQLNKWLQLATITINSNKFRTYRLQPIIKTDLNLFDDQLFKIDLQTETASSWKDR